MSVSRKLDFDLDNLPVDVFDLEGGGLAAESLTAGHGMTEVGASCPTCAGGAVCICSCFSL
ncbi:thiomuracin/GE37468 family thiazolyl RiPP peptide [Sphaerisporangium corydalis]|uniref:Thiomuracin/GE37468 family thiazolyl RiPP peptide n=1 Tax=Sphaerisporangium corydalis TaxID=1441875 RepID=A0ABV9E8X3_9ACTN|nr:thiomuracin/GE37468 family thiazolyl RiPP peptide [Sphaerisporangium corydalis]